MVTLRAASGLFSRCETARSCCVKKSRPSARERNGSKRCEVANDGPGIEDSRKDTSAALSVIPSLTSSGGIRSESYSESSMSFGAGAWIRIECWVPAVSVATVATDRRVGYCVGGVRRLSTERTSVVRKAEGGEIVWGVNRRVTDERRNISPDETEGRGA